MTEKELLFRKKRILWRCWHRGTRELDLLLGTFATRYLEQMSEKALIDFECLTEFPEPLIQAWLLGQESLPDTLNRELRLLIQRYRFIS